MIDNGYIAGYSFDQWKEMEERFEKDFENSVKYNKPFSALINEVLKGETAGKFEKRTGLTQNMLSRLKNRVDSANPSQKNTIITVCVAYDLDLMMAQALLYSQGSMLNRFNKNDYAYSFILTQCRGKSVDECNEILKKLGIEEGYLLGEYARKPRKKHK